MFSYSVLSVEQVESWIGDFFRQMCWKKKGKEVIIIIDQWFSNLLVSGNLYILNPKELSFCGLSISLYYKLKLRTF